MTNLSIIAQVILHTVHAHLARITPAAASSSGRDRDRGAVSLEQVLWFVAAGVGVAVIAAILWSQIRDQASIPVDSPSAP
jgi:hypothetical protein